MRRLFNWWWGKELVVHLLYIPTALNPGDPLSRVSLSLHHAVQWADDRFQAVVVDLSILCLVGSVFV